MPETIAANGIVRIDFQWVTRQEIAVSMSFILAYSSRERRYLESQELRTAGLDRHSRECWPRNVSPRRVRPIGLCSPETVDWRLAPNFSGALSGDIGSAGGGTGLFPSAPSLDQNEH